MGSGGTDHSSIKRVLANLLLDGGEDEGWCVAVGEEGNVAKDEFCAVGSFLTTSVIQFQAMKSTLTNLWDPHGGMTIFYLSEKQFRFKFYYEIDFERFIEGSP
ncbi:hypothetical protein Goari_000774 [Gossypium aridum]|uniref:DUF4283 domain-containing protein n=1 Tax=Gossypium aridum TaxID=34290 RepID=A0A7J8YHP8_GOSAI|nr:hypothetical protein [Gossypium aridum]